MKALIRGHSAHVVVEQVVRNESSHQVEASNVWPVPPGMSPRDFKYFVDGRPVATDRLEGYSADIVYRRAAEGADNPRILAYLGRPFFRGTTGPIPAEGKVEMRMEYEVDLPERNGVLIFHHPLSTNSFSAKPIERVSLKITIGNEHLRPAATPNYPLRWNRTGEGWEGNHSEAGSRLVKDLAVYITRSDAASSAQKVTIDQHVKTLTTLSCTAPEGETQSVGSRTLTLRDGFWTESTWPKTPWTIRIARFSPAYWELLWKWPDLKGTLAAGPRLRFIIKGEPVEIGDRGATELTSSDRGRLKLSPQESAPHIPQSQPR